MSDERKTGRHIHIGRAVFSAGVMALALAGGMDYLGLTQRLNHVIEAVFLPKGMAGPVLVLSPVIVWIYTAAIAFALPAVILNIPGVWRRFAVWMGALAVTITWSPVLILAAHGPQIGVALVAILWSGFCAMFYSASHDLPVDRHHANPEITEDGQS